MYFLALTSPLLVLLLSFIVIFTPVRAFNALVPKDKGAACVGNGIAYGADPRQRLDIYRPQGPAAGLPVIVFCYGGAWFKGNRQAYEFVGRSLAVAGHVVAVIDYRLVPRAHFPDFINDTALAVTWAARHIGEHGGDPDRIFLLGHSAGAYNAVMAALREQLPVRAVVGISGPYDFLPLRSRATRRAFGNWPRPEETQPATLARASAPPMLLMAGELDRTVNPGNTVGLFTALRDAGAPVVMKIYPRLKHASPILAFARPFRSKSSVRDDVLAYVAANS